MPTDSWAKDLLTALNKIADSPSTNWKQSSTYDALPIPTNCVGETWLVLSGTGIWPLNKPSGWYYSNGTAWIYLGAYNPVVTGGNVTVTNFPSTTPLPAGASTEATLAAIKAKTDNLDVALSTRTKSSDSQVVIELRPSQKAGRTNFRIQVSNATAAVDTLHAPAGKVLYVTDFLLTGQNSGTAIAPFTIQNYTIVEIPLLIGATKGTNPPALFSIAHSFQEPVPFSINVFLNPGASTTLTYSFFATGYYE